GRRLAAAAIAGRPRHRTGAVRPDLERAEAVDMGDGAATGAHRIDVEHGYGEVAPLDLAPAGQQRLAILDQGDVAGGAAHVESDEVLEAAHAAGERAGGDAARGAGQHGGDRAARGGRESRHAAVRLHDVFLRGCDVDAGKSTVEPGDIARQDRLQ